jgi:uncharacterized membrane protein YfcA
VWKTRLVVEPSTYVLLVGAGIIAGALNVVAGGGSFVTLPLLIFLGLPAAVANGTNRVGVLVQSAGAAWGFKRAKMLDSRWALAASVPAVAGSAVGSWAALHIGDDVFRRVLAIVMVIVTLTTLFAPEPRPEAAARSARSWFVVLGFAAAGVYGGFLQAGVGFLILALTAWAGLDMVRGNAIKVASVLLVTALAVAVFVVNGRIDWPMGLALAAGNAMGSAVGVRLAVRKGHAWLKGVVTVTILVLAVRLWWF